MMKPTDGIPTYDSSASEVAFPLGGVGTGNVSLGARGDLRDWEIFNSPAKGNNLPNTFFAIRLQPVDGDSITRVLEGPVQAPHILSHGYHPTTSNGLPRFAKSTFRGEYPLASIQFEDDSLPVSVELEAYTPLIPLNPQDSGIPCAILTYSVTNTSTQSLNLTLVGSIANPVGGLRRDAFGNLGQDGQSHSVNENRDDGDLRGLFLRAAAGETDDLHFGNMALVTDHQQVTVKRAWLRGAWYDFLREFWNDLTDDGLLNDLGYETPPEGSRPDTGSLGLLDTLEPGETHSYRFYLTWYFPNRENRWKTRPLRDFTQQAGDVPDIIRNHYATCFEDAWDVARYTFNEFDRLQRDTTAFHDALFGSTLPPAALDAISANIVPVRSTTCFWLEDGRFYGWEGCFDDAGCCPGSCTHVWSYAHTAAFLFPSLERSMRETEFEVETGDDGYMSFRTFRNFGTEFVWPWGNQRPEAAVDGQMGCILRAYREWQLSGDRAWLQRLWPYIKSSMSFADAQWDTDNDHVLDGKQHNTYDIEFYGPNPLSSIYYLAALRAVEAMATIMDEPQIAQNCHMAFEKGSQNLDAMLWNGEFYIQKLDDVDAYHYQHGIGCLSDQLLGQLHANILGLGNLLPADHIRSAIAAIYKHNFCTNFDDHVNCQRTYVLNDEAGLLLCSWPNGGEPKFPFVYSDEVWTGIEYQVAAHLIYEGWIDEGLSIVEAVRQRHDGYRRNPWNEVECGHHYARSMSSWAVLLALSGAQADLGKGELRFNPAASDANHFEIFWSTGKAWGTFSQTRDHLDGEWRRQFTILGGTVDNLKVFVGETEIAI